MCKPFKVYINIWFGISYYMNWKNICSKKKGVVGVVISCNCYGSSLTTFKAIIVWAIVFELKNREIELMNDDEM